MSDRSFIHRLVHPEIIFVWTFRYVLILCVVLFKLTPTIFVFYLPQLIGAQAIPHSLKSIPVSHWGNFKSSIKGHKMSLQSSEEISMLFSLNTEISVPRLDPIPYCTEGCIPCSMVPWLLGTILGCPVPVTEQPWHFQTVEMGQSEPLLSKDRKAHGWSACPCRATIYLSHRQQEKSQHSNNSRFGVCLFVFWLV